MFVVGRRQFRSGAFRLLALVAISLLYCGATATAQGFLTKSSQCGKAKFAIQTDPGKFGDAALQKLADECLQQAKMADSKKASAFGAYDAARLYDEAARRANQTPTKTELLAKAEEAAALSRNELEDTAQALAGGSSAEGRLNDRVKFQRGAILAGAKLQRGLLATSPAGAKCLNDQPCLQAGLALLDGGLSLSRAIDPDVYDRLQILAAKAQEQLNPVDLDRALDRLVLVIDQSAIDERKAEARRLLLSIVTSQADLGTSPPVTLDSLSRSIRYLEKASGVFSATTGFSDERALIADRRGAALFERARLPSRTAVERNADLCAAIGVYRASLAGGSVALTKPSGIALNEGLGRSAFWLAQSEDAACDGRRSADLKTDALSAFESAWRARKTAGTENQSKVIAEHVALLPANSPIEHEMTALLLQSRGELAMRAWLLRGRSLMDAKRISEAESYFTNAINALPGAPEPWLERGKSYYERAGNNDADSRSLRLKADSDFKEADQKAGQNLEIIAEANFYRSMNETALGGSAKNAVEWADKAWRSNPSRPDYRYQACRAHLLAKAPALGESGKAACEINNPSAEGAILHAMMLFRDSQIRVKGSATRPPEQNEIFYQATKAFDDARLIWERERPNAAPEKLKLRWPGLATEPEIGKFIEYGRAISQACSVVTTTAPRPPADVVDNSEAAFKKFGLYSCKSFSQ